MSRFVSFFVKGFIRWMPDAFIIALLLSVLTFVLAITVASFPAEEALRVWGDSFWNLLAFTNQIALTLLLGYALANTAPVRTVLLGLAGLASTPFRAYAGASLLTGICALFSWGLSLIAAGIMARAIGTSCRRKGVVVHYPLLVAAAFSGFVVWHQGLSSTIGLALATPGHFLERQIGLVPIAETLLSPWNICLAIVILATMPVLMASLHPNRAEEISEIPEDLMNRSDKDQSESTSEDGETTPARCMEESRLLSLLIVAAGVTFLFFHFTVWDRGLNLNTLNFGFLLLGLLLAGSPLRYVQIIVDGGRVAAPFLLQYPFYAGIAGLMGSSGLASMMVDFFVAFANEMTLPIIGFLGGGVLNLFIPSGGGQWAVQGPIMMSTAQALGADVPRVAMSVALGDQWTNLIQPLSIIPVLAIAGLNVRQIMGYTFVALLWTGMIFSAALLFF